MRKLSLIFVSALSLTLSCTQFDDTAIWDELPEHEQRIEKLEQDCQDMNASLTALKTIVAALEDNDYVKEVTEIFEDGKTVGYKITFGSRGSVEISSGYDGDDGSDGANGYTPEIGIARHSDGEYYWTLDGEWMMDTDGNMLPATGRDGLDGEDGDDGVDGSDGVDGADGADGAPGVSGQDGVTPLLKIEDGYWYVSYDDGATWERLYQAVTEDGKDGTSFFRSVDVSNPDFVVLTLANGEQIKLPTWKAFEELQALVNMLNSNLTAMQEIVEAMLDHDSVTDIRPVIENGVEVGYTIWFSSSLPITIYHGADGAPGEDGDAGVDGADGHAPVIGMAKDADGSYYWTVDGEWLLDDKGNKVVAVGGNGEDGMTPKLMIDAGYWCVSYDGGKSWTALGPVDGTAGALGISKIDYDEAYVYITMANGDEVALPRLSGDLSDRISFDPVDVDGNVATFSGSVEVPAEDNLWSGVRVYYSQASETFNIYSAAYVDASLSGGRFSVSLFDLKYDTSYKFCVRVKTKSEEYYGSVAEFSTEVFGEGMTFNVHYQTGDFNKSGYFYTTPASFVMNGFGTPVLKSRFPEKLDALQFYLIGVEEGVQPITAFVGCMTDPDKIATFKILKSLTSDVYLTKSYAKVILPLDVDLDDLSEIPDDGMVYVGIYPPSGVDREPIGRGYTAKTAQGYVETDPIRGVYGYYHINTDRYIWAVSSQKNPIYYALITLQP